MMSTLTVLLMTMLLLSTGPALAQSVQDGSDSEMERMLPDKVDVEADPEEVDLGTAELVTESSLRWTLGDTEALTIIPASELAPGQTLVETLERIPGFDVRSRGGHGQLSAASLRGAHGEQVLLLLDGSPASAGIATDLSTLPLAGVESIEVLRGPQASRFGPGALGGVINLISRRPESVEDAGSFYTPSTRDQLQTAATVEQGQQSTLTTTAGSYGVFQTDLSAADSAAVWQFSHQQAANDYPFERSGNATAIRANNESEQQHIWASWGDGDLGHRLGLSRLRRGVAGSAEFPTLQASLSRQNLWWQTRGNGWTADFSAARTHFVDPEPYLMKGVIENEDRRYRLSAATGAYAAGRSQWGLRPRFDLIDSAEYGSHSRSGVDITHFWDDRHGKVSTQLELGLLASSDVGVDPVARAGIGWDADAGLHLYASAGLAGRHPDFEELYLTGTGSVEGNPDLLPERVMSLEAGANWKSGGTALSGAVFASRYEESIIFAPVSGYLVRAINTGRSDVGGAELLLTWKISARGSWKTAYTWLPVARYASGVRLTGRARSHLSSTLTLPAGAWDAGLELDASSAIPADLFGNLWIRPRALLGLDLSRSFGQSRLLLRVDNLLDESTRDSWNYPLPGREYSITWRTNL